jgi:penicillin-binding protein 2
MKFMSPKLSLSAGLLVIFLSFSFAAGDISAQSRKKAADKKAAAKKSDTRSKTAEARGADAKKKGREKTTAAKGNRRDNRTAARDNKRDKKAEKKLTAREKREQARREKLADARDKARDKKDRDKKDRNDKLSRAERRKADAEARRREAERRAAILAERRRREQARREAIARQIAFERGLRTETENNILKDNTEGEDLGIRRAAINALGNHAGSVVVMEAQTGKVLTIVNQDWAVRAPIKPCSTIKLVTGVAGLNEGVISKEDGTVRNTRTRRALDDALAFSDNPYFQRVGTQIGSKKTIEYARALGLGEPTGLNTENEAAGKLPFGSEHAKIYSHGQDFEVTGLQLAVMVSAITNGGHRVLPRVPRTRLEHARFQPFYRANVELPQQNLRRVIPGMMGAADYGTARRGVDHSLGIAGKTGSCISKGSWVGLFASVAPIERPKYSVVVITRGQRERGKYAAAVAGQIYSALKPHIVRTNTNLAQTEFNLRPRTKVETLAAAKVADPDDEDDETMAEAGDGTGDAELLDGSDVIVVPSAPKKAPARLVTKTGDSKPLFNPVVIAPVKKP